MTGPPCEQSEGWLSFTRATRRLLGFSTTSPAIRDVAGREIHLLVIGCATREKIHEVYQRFPEATIVTNKPIRKGNSGHGFLEDLTSSEQFEQPKETLIQENIALFTRICKNFRDGASLLDLATVRPVRSADPRQLLLPGIGLRPAGLPATPQAVRRSARMAP